MIETTCTTRLNCFHTTYTTGSGASPEAGRILRACHCGSGHILMDDLFRLEPQSERQR